MTADGLNRVLFQNREILNVGKHLLETQKTPWLVISVQIYGS